MPDPRSHHSRPVEEAPLDQQIAAEEELLERNQQLVAADTKLKRGLSDLREEYGRKIRALVGPEKHKKALEEYRKVNRAFEETLGKFPLTAEGEEKERRHRRKIRKAKHDFYHGLGFDVEKAVKIRKDFVAKAGGLVDKSFDKKAEVEPEPEVEPPALSENPWTWLSAPYGVQWTYSSVGGSKGYRWRSAAASPASGEIDLWNRADLFGSDDSDWSQITVYGEVGSWYQMPAAGLVEVWLYLQDINTNYTGRLWDESGCSDADVRQRAQAYLWTSGGGGYRFSNLVNYHRGESSGPWTVPDPWGPGSWHYVHLFSGASYPAGQWVSVRGGLKDYNYFWVDDMSCRTEMRSNWFVRYIRVRSTGAP